MLFLHQKKVIGWKLHNSSVGILPVTRLTVEIEKSLRESAYEIPEAEVEWSQSPSNQLKKGNLNYFLSYFFIIFVYLLLN